MGERDSLLAHGAAYLLHDRLHASSDYSTIKCCRRCGSILSVWHEETCTKKSTKDKIPGKTQYFKVDSFNRLNCRLCKTSFMVDSIAIPYVFKFLAVELAAMNIKLRLDIR